MSFVFNFKGNEVVFIHIPKNAGSSLSVSLDRYNPHLKNPTRRPNNSFVYHHTYLETHKLFEKNIDRNYFAISRNPWDRAVSFYSYIQQEPGCGAPDIHEKINNQNLTFENFIDIYTNDKRDFFRPQMKYITNENSKVVVDVLRLENINEEIIDYLSRFKVDDIKLAKINTSKHVHYSSFYDSNDLIDKVAKFEEGIIDYHNYKFEKK